MVRQLSGFGALLQRRINLLEEKLELIHASFPESADLSEILWGEIKGLQNELESELSSRRVVLLGVVHACQDVGHPANREFGARLKFLVESYAATIVLEEWARDRAPSFASEFAKDGRHHYRDIGTSGDPALRTFANAPISFPGHDGTLGPCADAPELREYGPLDTQEQREERMVRNIEGAMAQHRVALLVVGLAHLHSMSVKLSAAGFKIAAYSWIEL